MARTLDAYQQRIQEMLRREQEFTANVSHELRTPLTEIRTSCELLALDTGLSEKSRARVRYIAKAEQDMRAHMEALLFLARDQSGASKETVALRECIEDIVASLLNEIVGKKLALTLDIVKRICEREQWGIRLDSSPDKGTTVQIDFQQASAT